jgi:hypothetical protein
VRGFTDCSIERRERGNRSIGTSLHQAAGRGGRKHDVAGGIPGGAAGRRRIGE